MIGAAYWLPPYDNNYRHVAGSFCTGKCLAHLVIRLALVLSPLPRM